MIKKNQTKNKDHFFILNKKNYLLLLPLLEGHGFIRGYSVVSSTKIKVFLKYFQKLGAIHSIFIPHFSKLACYQIKKRKLMLLVKKNQDSVYILNSRYGPVDHCTAIRLNSFGTLILKIN